MSIFGYNGLVIKNDCNINFCTSLFGDSYEIPNGYAYRSNEAKSFMARS